MADFKLSASLSGHDDDVKGVSFPSPKAIISASRDGTVRIWNLLSDKRPLYDATISSHSPAFVNTVAYLPPTSEHQEGLIISGGKDAIVDVRAPSKKPEDAAEALLLGHSGNVCALNVDPDGKFIVSGSWDTDARIWSVGKWETDVVLKGHDHAPWAVLAYDSNTILTGSGDSYIRIYNRAGKLVNKFLGSDTPVRSLCRLPKGHPSAADFASAANDGIIKFWSLSGQQLGEAFGHESFVYSIAALPSGELVSSGEDRTVRVWKGDQCVQTITHPAISVWQVAVCTETGDIVTGASDKIVRVFTRDSERFADAETTKHFEDSVAESSIPQQKLGGAINKETLPRPDFLTNKSGTKDGQIQMIHEVNGSVMAYQWSSSQNEWIKVGTVVDAVGSSGKKTDYMGKEYDYVFDVDIEDGKPPLKLPYNLSQNPYEAATKFINDNKLPITYLDQVANFITTNTQGATLGEPSSTATSGPGSDPWGSDNRYRPGETSASTPSQPPKILPQKEYLTILMTEAPKIQKKVNELNQTLIEGGRKDISLNPTELSILANLTQHIVASGAAKNSKSVLGGLDLAVKLATRWPYKDRLPGIDLLRLLAIEPDTAKFSEPGGNIIDVFVAACTEEQPPAHNHLMLAIRGFANLFDTAGGRNLAVSEFDKIQNVVTTSLINTSNRNISIAAVTLYINFAVLFTSTPEDSSFEHALAVLDTLVKILKDQKDTETIYRCLVALGTLLTLDDEIRSAGKDVYGVEAAVKGVLEKSVDTRIKNISKEIGALLK